METGPIIRESITLPKIRRSLATACVLGAVSLGAMPSPACAADGWFDEWMSQPTMTGDWGGARTDLINAGVSPFVGFIGEMSGNTTGGMNRPGKGNTGTRYSQQVAFGAEFDFQKLANLTGWAGKVEFTDRVGRNLAKDVVGNKFTETRIFGQGQTFRLTNLSLTKTTSDQMFKVKAGWFPIGQDYDTSPYFCNFQANTFCSKTVFLTNDSKGWLNGPAASWAGWVRVAPRPSFYIQAGGASVNPSYSYTVSPGSTHSDNGLKMDLSGATGQIYTVETGWIHGEDAGFLPGDVKVGAYYDDSNTADIRNTKINQDKRYGAYMTVNQKLYREAPGSQRGLAGFVTGGAGDRATAQVLYGVAVGLVYTGTFKGRDADTVNLAWGRNYVNTRLLTGAKAGYKPYEETVELNYGIQLAPWFSVRPGMQYVFNTGAFALTPASQKYGDAFIYDTEVVLKF